MSILGTLYSYNGRRYPAKYPANLSDHDFLRWCVDNKEVVPPGDYVLRSTFVLGEGETLRLHKSAKVKVWHTGAGVLVNGSNSGISGGTLTGLSTIPFVPISGGLWESRRTSWEAALRNVYPIGWTHSMLVKNNEWIQMSRFPSYPNRIAGTGTEAWANTATYTADQLPAWNQGTFTENVLNHWDTFGNIVNSGSELAAALTQRARPWFIRNNIASLTPGTYCYDSAVGRFLYMPLPGEELSSCVFDIPFTERLVEVAGQEGNVLDNVRFFWCRMEGAGASTVMLTAPGGGNPGISSSSHVHTAVRVSYARTSFDWCVIRNCSRNGIVFWKFSDYSRVSHSRVEDCGIGCVFATNWGDADNLVRGITIEDSWILRGSRLGSGSALIGFRFATEGVIRRNKIGECPWGAVYCPGYYGERSYVVEDNEIYDGMRDLTDGALFYTSWAASTSYFRRNYLHTLGHAYPTYTGGTACILHDANARGWIVEDNLMATHPAAQGGTKVNLGQPIVYNRNKFWGPAVKNSNHNNTVRHMYPDGVWGAQDSRVILSVVDNGDDTASFEVATDNRNLSSYTDVGQNWVVAGKGSDGDNRYIDFTVGTSTNFWTNLVNTTILIAQTGANPGHTAFVDSFTMVGSFVRLGVTSISSSNFDNIQVGDVYKAMWPGITASGYFLRMVDGAAADKGFPMSSYTVLNKDQIRFTVRLNGLAPHPIVFGGTAVEAGTELGSNSIEGIMPGDRVIFTRHLINEEEKLTDERLSEEVALWRASHPTPAVPEG
jgi:hypothetical protein